MVEQVHSPRKRKHPDRGKRKAARDQWELLQRTNAYNRSLLEASVDPLVTIGPDGKITDVNAATEAVTGRSRAELIGTDFFDYFTEPARARAGYEQAFREGAVRDYELAIRHRDGHVTDVLYNASVYRDEAGQVMGVFAAARDITERKRAEAALRRAGTYNRSLIEASVDPLVTIGPDGKITDVNAATEAVTGRSRAELIGTDFSDYFTEPARARAGYEQVFREGAVRDYALELRHRDGHTTPVLYNASVYRDEQGAVIGVFAAARDITERKRAEEALHALNAELEERVAKRTEQLEAAVKELEDISYSVSHDLWIPLRAVDGYAAILLADHQAALDAEGKRLLNVIRANTKRMGRLIDDILTFLRLGRIAMKTTDVDMNDLVQEVLRELELMVRGRAVQMAIKPLPRAWGDYALLRQVVMNLLSNAFKFTRPKATAIVDVGGYETAGECVYYVRDNGVGFDMRYSDKLFGVFQRLHGVEEFEGTGMGLAIAHRIVMRHGGRIWAESSINVGSTLYFALPKQPPAQAG